VNKHTLKKKREEEILKESMFGESLSLQERGGQENGGKIRRKGMNGAFV